MLIINNRFLSLYDYNFLLVIEKIFSVNSKICGSILKKPFTVSEKRFCKLGNYFLLLAAIFLSGSVKIWHNIKSKENQRKARQ
jgi:hypothetical protein